MSLFAVPPLLNFLGIVVSLLLLRRWRRVGLWGLGLSLGSLVLFAVPLTGALLLRSLQHDPALPAAGPLPAADAIVILGADQEVSAPEYGGSTVGALTLERLRYGAHLAQRAKVPVLLSGGVLMPGRAPLSEDMAIVLRNELGVTPRWVETRSKNTRQNARRSAELLRAAGGRRILLVTHAWHMPRAARVFAVEGLEVIPAPMGFRARPQFGPGDFMPSAKGLQQSAHGLHEYLGDLWYRLTAR